MKPNAESGRVPGGGADDRRAEQREAAGRLTLGHCVRVVVRVVTTPAQRLQPRPTTPSASNAGIVAGDARRDVAPVEDNVAKDVRWRRKVDPREARVQIESLSGRVYCTSTVGTNCGPIMLLSFAARTFLVLGLERGDLSFERDADERAELRRSSRTGLEGERDQERHADPQHVATGRGTLAGDRRSDASELGNPARSTRPSAMNGPNPTDTRESSASVVSPDASVRWRSLWLDAGQHHPLERRERDRRHAPDLGLVHHEQPAREKEQDRASPDQEGERARRQRSPHVSPAG